MNKLSEANQTNLESSDIQLVNETPADQNRETDLNFEEEWKKIWE